MAEKSTQIVKNHDHDISNRQVDRKTAPVVQQAQSNLADLSLALNSPSNASPAAMMALQRLAGNRAVSHFIQTKLTVGAADDAYEREADQVASRVVAMLQPSAATAAEGGVPVQREMLEDDEQVVQGKPLASEISRLVQREVEDEEELQMKPLAQRAPDEEEDLIQAAQDPQGIVIDPRGSFEAGAEIESRIAAQKGNGAHLPEAVRVMMEPRFGADFGQVRLHTGSQSADLNRALSAQAFTHGSDIFMGAGRYDPNSVEGQHLLAHELTHTIQQGASPLQAQRSPSSFAAVAGGVQAASVVQSGMVQLKMALVTNKAHTRLLTAPVTGTPKENDKTINKSPQGSLLTKGDTIDISDSAADHVKDANDSIIWYRTKNAASTEYVRGEKVILSEAPTDGVTEDSNGEDLLGAFKDQVLGTSSEGIGAFEKEISQSVKSLSERKKAGGVLSSAESAQLDDANGRSDRLTTGSSVIGAGSGILGMALAIKSLAGEGETKEKINAAFDLVSSMMDTGSNLATFSSKVSGNETVNTTGEAAGKWMDSLSGMLGTLQKGIGTIFNVVEIIKMIASDQKFSSKEYLAKGSELLNNALETAKGVVKSISSVYDAIGETASEALAFAAVGLDIAINAIKGIMQGYYLAVSARQWYLMSGREKEMTGELAGDPTKQAALKEARSSYTSHEAQIAKIDELKKKNEVKIQKIQAKMDALPTVGKKWDSLYDEREKLKDENIAFDLKKADHQKAINDYEVAHGDMSREKLEEFGLVQELGSANRKRVVRQSIHIGTTLAKIAGGIANLSGAGAVAGVAIKASATGIDLSLPLFRSIKQWGRNMAAANLARGETGISNKIFNADKNTVAKQEARKRHALVILKLVAKLNDYIPTSSDPLLKAAQTETLKRHMAQVEGYIRATGCSPETLYRANGNLPEQLKILAAELSKREFND